MRSIIVNFLLVALAVFGVAAPARADAPADEWPCWLGPNHDGKSTDKGLLKEWPTGGPKQLWKASGIGIGYASVAVVGGKVYITGDEKDKGNLSAFDLEGKLLWKVECGQASHFNLERLLQLAHRGRQQCLHTRRPRFALLP